MRILSAVALLSLVVAAVAVAPRDKYAFAPGATVEARPSSVNEDLCFYIGVTSGCSGCEATKGLCKWNYVYDSSYFGVEGLCMGREETLATTDPLFHASSTCPTDASMEPSFARNKFPFKSAAAYPSSVSSQWFSSWHENDLANFPKNPWPVDRTSRGGVAGYNALIGSPTWAFNDPAVAAVRCHTLTSAELFDANFILEGFVANERDRFCAKKFLDLYLAATCPAYGVPLSGLCASAAEELELNCAPCKTNVRLRVHTFSFDFALTIPLRDDFYILPDETPYCLKELPDLATPQLLALAGLTSATSTPTFRPYTPYAGAPVCN